MGNPPASASLLFGAIANSAVVKKGKNGSFDLSLKGFNTVDWFTDRPDRDAGSWSAKKLVKQWQSLFGSVEPNAQMTIMTDGEKEVYAFEMFKPGFDKKSNELSFKTKPIGQKNIDLITGLAASGGVFNGVSLFIDDSGTAADLSLFFNDAVDDQSAKPGSQITYTLTVENVSEVFTSANVNVSLSEKISQADWTAAYEGGAEGPVVGGGGPDVSFDLTAGSLATFTIVATIASDAVGEVVTTATVIDGDQSLSASVVIPLIPSSLGAADAVANRPTASTSLSASALASPNHYTLQLFSPYPAEDNDREGLFGASIFEIPHSIL